MHQHGSGNPSYQTNQAVTAQDNADQPWLLYNRGPGNPNAARTSTSPTTISARTRWACASPPRSTACRRYFRVGATSWSAPPQVRSIPAIGSPRTRATAGCAACARIAPQLRDPRRRPEDDRIHAQSVHRPRGDLEGERGFHRGWSSPRPTARSRSRSSAPSTHCSAGSSTAAVDPSTGDIYYVYGSRDASGNNRLAIGRVFDNGGGGVDVGARVVRGERHGAGRAAVGGGHRHGTLGVFYYTYNGMVSGFPQFSTWLATSTDKGATLTARLLATFLSPATDNSNARQRVFGDYVQMKAVDDCFYGSYTGNGAAFGRSVGQQRSDFLQGVRARNRRHPRFQRRRQERHCLARALLGPGPTGNVAIWLMNGTQILSSPDLGNVPTSWTIVGQRPVQQQRLRRLALA